MWSILFLITEKIELNKNDERFYRMYSMNNNIEEGNHCCLAEFKRSKDKRCNREPKWYLTRAEIERFEPWYQIFSGGYALASRYGSHIHKTQKINHYCACALASLDARASAGAALTQKLDMCSSKVSWIKGDSESVFPDYIWSKMVSETSWCPATFRELNLVLTPVISHRIIVANKRCATQVLRYLVH